MDSLKLASPMVMEKKLLKRFTWVVMGVLLWSSAALAGPESQVLGNPPATAQQSGVAVFPAD